MAEAGEDVVQAVYEADKDPYLNSRTDLTSMSSSETGIFWFYIFSLQIQKEQVEVKTTISNFNLRKFKKSKNIFPY